MKGNSETDQCYCPVPPVKTIFWVPTDWDKWLFMYCPCEIHGIFRNLGNVEDVPNIMKNPMIEMMLQ